MLELIWGKLVDLALAALGNFANVSIPDDLKRRVVSRIADHNPFGGAIATNHDLIRTVRIAWIQAALLILEAGQKQAPTPDWLADSDNIRRFAVEARSKLIEMRDAAFSRVGHPGETAIDAFASQIIICASESVGPSTTGPSANSITTAFAATLSAITKWPQQEVPAVFGQIATEGLPTSEGARRPFGELVVDSFGELIKDTNYPQARRALDFAMHNVNRQLAETILTEVHRIDASVPLAVEKYMDKIVEEQHAQRRMIEDFNRQLQAADVIRRAREGGIPETLVWAAVELFAKERVTPGNLIPSLNSWIETVIEQLKKETSEGERFEAARREAEQRFKSGELARASSAFVDELEREAREEEKRQLGRKSQRIRLLEEAIRFDELALDAVSATKKLQSLAELEGVVDQAALAQWMRERGSNYYQRGDEKGENGALLIAIELYRSALSSYSRKNEPELWVATQVDLGLAYLALGAREIGTARVEKAIEAFREAQKLHTRTKHPLEWASLQVNLGNALYVLGEREAGTTGLEAAVAAFRAALKMTPRVMKREWASIQNNLGNALTALAEREVGTNRLKEAIKAYNEALQTAAENSLPGADFQNNLGNALATLGEREIGTDSLKLAVAACQVAISGRPRAVVPLDWASSQHNLGNALTTLGEREPDKAYLVDAVRAYREALSEITAERVPLDRARSLHYFSHALAVLGKRDANTVDLREAVAICREALSVYTRERVSLQWSIAQHHLGNALSALGECEDDGTYLEQAIAAYRSALEERKELKPFYAALSSYELGNVLCRRSQRAGDEAQFDEAIEAYRQALNIAQQGFPDLHEKIRSALERAERLRLGK